MMLTYGCLSFEVERVYRWDYRAVYDDSGLDYLYDHVVIGVQAVFHPGATVSNDVTGTPRVGVNGVGFGALGSESVRDLYTIMMQPRQKLTLTLGNKLVLESPLRDPGTNASYSCDAKGGPQPLNFRVIAIHGVGKTLVCTFDIETWINGFNNSSATPSLLSHRWTMSHDIDELNYTTRTIRGKAIFRKDHLVSHPLWPAERYADDFRERIFHPIPLNFQRKSVHVTQSPDGTTLDYTITDQEQPANLGKYNPVLKIKSRLRMGYDSPTMLGITPKRHVEITVQVWGRRSSTKQDLFKACARAAAAFGFGDVLSPTAKLYFRQNWDVDLVDRYVGLTVGLTLSGFVDNFYTWATGRSFRDMWPTENGNFPEAINGVTTVLPDENPRPEHSGARAGYFGRMVAQSLMNPATNPAQPGAEQNGGNYPVPGVGGY